MPMSDSSLRAASAKGLGDVSTALVSIIRRLSASRGASAVDEIPAERLRNDLISLSQSLSKLATQLGIASKPPISGQAGWNAISELSASLADLVSKMSFATGRLGSSFMAKELRWASTDVLEAVQNFTSSLATSLRKSASISAIERERHLQLIGIVWKSAEKVSRCSAHEAEALCRALISEVEVMDDGLDEARDLLDATGSISSDKENDDDETSETLTELERRRVENAIRLLTSAKRLVKRVIALLQHSSPGFVAASSSELARVHSVVSSLVASQDDLISSLPGPQDVEDLRVYAQAMLGDAQTLAELAVRLWPPDPGQPDMDSLISDLTLDNASDRSISLNVFPGQLADVGRQLAVL